MAKNLKITEPTDTMRSLPPRLARLERSLGTVQWPGQPMRLNFPSGMELTADERQWISGRLKALDHAIAGSGENPKDQLTAKLSLLTELLLAYPATKSGDEQIADARLKFYLEAVSDVAAWALDAAIKRWVRGDVPAPNVDFAPSPGGLRRICEDVLAPFKEHRQILIRLESALPIEEAMNPKPLALVVK